MADRLAALTSVPVFAALDRERIGRVAARSPVREVARDAVVALCGEPARHLIVVESGMLAATYDTAHGRRLRLGDFPAPCAVDKTAVLDGRGYTATWVATAPSRVRLVPADEFLGLLDDVPATRRHVLRTLSGQIRDHQNTLVDAYVSDATTRTAGWLVRAVSRTGATKVTLPGSQQGLAEAVGVTRVSVNRALRTLAHQGLIRTEPGAVEVLAPELLARRAGDSVTPATASSS